MIRPEPLPWSLEREKERAEREAAEHGSAIAPGGRARRRSFGGST